MGEFGSLWLFKHGSLVPGPPAGDAWIPPAPGVWRPMRSHWPFAGGSWKAWAGVRAASGWKTLEDTLDDVGRCMHSVVEVERAKPRLLRQ